MDFDLLARGAACGFGEELRRRAVHLLRHRDLADGGMRGFAILVPARRGRDAAPHAELEAVDLDPLLMILLRNLAVYAVIFQVNSHCVSFPRLVNEPWAPPDGAPDAVEATPPPRCWSRRPRRLLQRRGGRQPRRPPHRP